MIGKVLDASAVDAFVRREITARGWVTAAYALSSPLYIPTLAFAEVLAVRPDAGSALVELNDHPSVLVRELAPGDTSVVRDLLTSLGKFDALAAQVVHVAGTRGWPALTADPERLRRLAPDVAVDLI